MLGRFRRKPFGAGGSGGYLRVGRLACAVCDYSVMGSAVYVTVVGLIGTVITALDVIRIVNCKPAAECPAKCRPRGVVPVEVERDLKLMTSILGIEHYTLIMLGAITNYPMLHAPWLLMQLCIIAVELLVFLARLFLEGLHVSRDEILLGLLSVHNWLQVFCLFQRQTYRRVI